MAVYQNNSSSLRYYFIKDQIGNTRVMVGDTGRVVYYANYYPFGNIQTSYVAYNEPMKFTGKERDSYRDFEYDYFGARYYDPDIGMFSTVDKAAQLASGFNYCGNNPVMMVDEDGNFAFLACMLTLLSGKFREMSIE